MASRSKKTDTSTPLPTARQLLDWYDRHARDLPWRISPKARKKGAVADPYKVWLSEIMLQQTTVKTVGPYFLKFVEMWPRVEDLAAASSPEVMSAWAGLGYYSRARNLHACAKVVADQHGGTFPQTEDGLLALPGIGPYTAAAVASIAFDQPAAVMDGNVERVVSRLFAIDTPLPVAKTHIKERLNELVPQKRPGDFAQATMDLGATLCSPKKPACALCPWTEECAANAKGIAETLPVKPPKKAKPTRYGSAYWLTDAKGHVLLRTRPPKGLLGGMDEVPGSEWSEQTTQPTTDEAPAKTDWQQLPGKVTHVFTHFALELTVYTAQAATRSKVEGDWVPLDALAQRALPTVMRKIVAHADPEAAKQFRKKA
ncbi:A/G-specific adenine glycosylase [Candidatus Phaeomarinobacter ectocarpi]|uniref:Adenine DNA glycosylase n=1 Tax=Candidatus Phaeomarinibacter ectocarpi TaxID=1458461 RepID=X5MMI3_9HYPH|nr:A/G-specific adenine glycosylase [Candidatus Phaeomarinobacter ectocarpi]CDO60460.1 A/G-specific adenine glycosylase [Candidatus Phaeomarinobacter ectocarpi]